MKLLHNIISCVILFAVNLFYSYTVPLQVNDTITHVKCHNGSTGAISLSVNGGEAPYEYLWSSGDTTESIHELSAGEYSYTVTDNIDSTYTDTLEVTEPTEINISENVVHNNCHGDSAGSISLTITGGTPPLEYLWDNGDTTKDINNLIAGSYYITVTDSNGCTKTTGYGINQPSTAISITSSIDSTTCFNSNDGAIDLSVSGGGTGYTYLWSNGASTQDLSGISKGSYEVTVTDDNNCEKIKNFVVPHPAEITINENIQEIQCHGDKNGSIHITSIDGGVAPYSYSWSNGKTDQEILGLDDGTYRITVTDAKKCTQAEFYELTDPPALSLSGNVTDATGINAGDGSINLTVTGGSPGYTYSWNNGQTTEDLSNLSPGKYYVTVKDINKCPNDTNFIVNFPSTITINHTVTSVNCYGGSDGEISLSLSDGTAPYSFNWSNGDTTQTINNLSSGDYSVTVTDNTGEKGLSIINVPEPEEIRVYSGKINPDCHGDEDGRINLAVFGGVGPYQYLWNTNDSTKNIIGLSAGTYHVTVTDSIGCAKTKSITLNQPDPIVINDSIINVSVVNGSNGAIYLDVEGGTAPFYYNWNTGDTSQNLEFIDIGIYSVTVVDKNFCKDSGTYEVEGVTPPLYTVAQTTSITCPGDDDGKIDITTHGGEPPHKFKWSNGATTEDLTGLSGGIYTITVTDSDDKTSIRNCYVHEPDTIKIYGNTRDIVCHDSNNGKISFDSIKGGVKPYQYQWSNDSTGSSISGLSPGAYTATIIDQNLCNKSKQFDIKEPPVINITSEVLGTTCLTCSNGGITVTVEGGVPPYDYLWNNGVTTSGIGSLSRDSYTLIISDNAGCEIIKKYDIKLMSPGASSQNPEPGASEISNDTEVWIQFNQDVWEGNLDNVVIMNQYNINLAGVSSTLDSLSNTLNIHHTEDFQINREYTVIVPSGTVRNTDSVGNRQISWKFQTINTGIEDINTPDPVIYPIPSNGVLFIKGLDVIQSNNILLTVDNILGNRILEKQIEPSKTIKIDMTNKSNGLYIIRFSWDDKVITKQIIIL